MTRRTAVGGALTIGGQGIKLLLQTGTTAVLARLLLPADFGVIAMVTPILTFFAVFKDLGLTSATVQKSSITPEQINTLFWLNVVAGVLLFAVSALTAPLSAQFFNVPQLRTVQLVLGSQFLLSGCLAQYVAVMQRELRFKTLVVLDLCSALLGAAAAILFASVHPNFWALVVGSLVTQSVWLVLILPVSGWHPGLPHWAPGTGASLRFGSEVASFNVLNFFSRNIDNVLIGKFRGEAPLGYYSRAYNLMLVPLSQVIYPLGQVMTPLLARLQDEPRRYAAVYRSAIGKVLLVCIPIVTVIIACSDWLVLLLLGPRWLPAAPVLRVLAVSALLQPINASSGWLFISQGRSNDLMRWGVVSSIITVGSIVAGFPFGILGVAIGFTAGQFLLTTPLLWRTIGRTGPVRSATFRQVMTPFVTATLISGTSFILIRQAWHPSPFFGLLAATSWMFGVQTGLMLFWRESREDLVGLWRFAADILLRQQSPGTA